MTDIGAVCPAARIIKPITLKFSWSSYICSI